MILKIGSTDDLPKAAAAILESLDGRSVVAFRGEMGAGKTTLIRAICDALGVTDTVTSPTFAIVNEYRGEGIPPVYHFDFYRIDRIEEYFYGGDLCLVEWPEKIESLLPDDAMTVRIEVTGEDSRTIEIDPQD